MLANGVGRSWGAQSAAAAAVEDEVPELDEVDGDEVEVLELDDALSLDELLRESVL